MHYEANNCHYRRHLRGSALSVYEFALGVSRQSGEFFAGIASCVRETNYSHDTVTVALKTLCSRGWLERLGGNRDQARAGGHFKPNRYRVLSHGEWAAKYPGQCGENSRGGKTPPRENPVAEKPGIPVAGKPRHVFSSTSVSKEQKEQKVNWNTAFDAVKFPDEVERLLAGKGATVRQIGDGGSK